MPSKRSAADEDGLETPDWMRKRARVGSSSSKAVSRARPVHHFKPQRKYRDHPESGVGKQFHSVPYPLSLLHKKAWEALNQGDAEGPICSQCGKSQQFTAHQKKLFLVAERLSWELGAVSSAERSQNEVNLWSVNALLDIFEPAVDDEDVVIGGRRSRADAWFPYKSKTEALMAMRVVEKAEILSERSWKIWKNTADLAAQQEEPEDATCTEDVLNLTGDAAYKPKQGVYGGSVRSPLSEISPNSKRMSGRHSPRKQSSYIPTPGSAPAANETQPLPTKATSCSIKTLQDFYSLLDKIERTSPVGAKFLEAYAERLHSESCKDCWFEKNVVKELMEDEPEPEPVPPSPRRCIPGQKIETKPGQHRQNSATHTPDFDHYTKALGLSVPIATRLLQRNIPVSTFLNMQREAAGPLLKKAIDAVAKRTETPDQVRLIREHVRRFALELLEQKEREEHQPGVGSSTTVRLQHTDLVGIAESSASPRTREKMRAAAQGTAAPNHVLDVYAPFRKTANEVPLQKEREKQQAVAPLPPGREQGPQDLHLPTSLASELQQRNISLLTLMNELSSQAGPETQEMIRMVAAKTATREVVYRLQYRLDMFADDFLRTKKGEEQQANGQPQLRVMPQQLLLDASGPTLPAQSHAGPQQHHSQLRSGQTSTPGSERTPYPAPYCGKSAVPPPAPAQYKLDVQLPAELLKRLQDKNISASTLVSMLAASPDTTSLMRDMMKEVALNTATPKQRRSVQSRLHWFAREVLATKEAEEQAPSGYLQSQIYRPPSLDQCFADAQRAIGPVTVDHRQMYKTPFVPPNTYRPPHPPPNGR